MYCLIFVSEWEKGNLFFHKHFPSPVPHPLQSWAWASQLLKTSITRGNSDIHFWTLSKRNSREFCSDSFSKINGMSSALFVLYCKVYYTAFHLKKLQQSFLGDQVNGWHSQHCWEEVCPQTSEETKTVYWDERDWLWKAGKSITSHFMGKVLKRMMTFYLINPVILKLQ